YDALGRDIKSTQYGQGKALWSTTTEYFGDHTRATPPRGGVVSTSWTDARGRQVRKQEGTGSDQVTTTYTYTPADKVATTTDPAGHRSSYTYDLLGRRTAADDADSGRSKTTYDDDDNELAMWDAKTLASGDTQPTLSTVYDKLDRPVSRWAGESERGTELASWDYDSTRISNGIGRVEAQTTHEGHHDYTVAITGYDAKGRITGKKWTFPAGLLSGLLRPQVYTVNYGYDAADHVTTVDYPDSVIGAPAEKLTTGYDDLGNAKTLTGASAGLLGGHETTYISDTGYASDGKLASRDYANPHHPLRRVYGYDAATQRLSQVQTLVGGGLLGGDDDLVAKQDDTYACDPDGNLTSITDNSLHTPVASCFTYDGLDRLAHAWTTDKTDCSDGSSAIEHDGPAGFNESWTYTKDGNIASKRSVLLGTKQFSYDDSEHPHAVTKAGAEKLDYDANGAMKSRVDLGLIPTTMQWDAEHRLSSVTTEHLLSTRFVYAPDGTRMARIDPTGSATLYIDGQEITLLLGVGLLAKGIRFYQMSATTVAQRVYGVLSWQFNDMQGSAQIHVLAGTGLISRTYYDPFGDIRLGSHPPATDHGFLGKIKDPTTGLDALGARYYDADLGRFISTDPALDPSSAQTLNPYTYGANNPLAYADPTGLWSLSGAWNGIKKGVSAAADWASEHKGLIANVAVGIGVGIAVGAVCATGVGCLILAGAAAGAAGAAAGYGVDVSEGKQDFSWGGLASNVAIGAVTGAATAGLAKGAGALAKTGAGALAKSGAGQAVKAAASTAGKAVANTAKAAGSKVATSGAGKAASTAASKVATAARSVGRAVKPLGRSGACSFAAATPVLMANGTHKPISKVKVGDKVVAADPTTGRRAAKKVTKLWVHQDTLVALSVAGKLITTTEDHPFWNATDREWQRADQLGPGDKVVTASGRTLRVDGIRASTSRVATAYNLTVEGIHTYYAGDAQILVHNNNTCSTAISAARSVGGRRGGAAVRAQLDDVRDEMLAANPDWVHTAGGRSAATGAKLPERAVNNPSGPGRRFPDLTFDLPDGSQVYVNTVDTYANGAATIREFEAALDIANWGTGPIIMIPK
ncbi:MAG TPA: RHS repeat-associated core domain-containing protein, partial [Actinopolymorphaceae bacterium]|nr:RHS repeat-associated core domain-containing protein [Actinopolymorphaceae bacterium]